MQKIYLSECIIAWFNISVSLKEKSKNLYQVVLIDSVDLVYQGISMKQTQNMETGMFQKVVKYSPDQKLVELKVCRYLHRIP